MIKSARFAAVGVAGATAGAVGTLAMDLLWWRRARRGGDDSRFGEWEFSGDMGSFDEAAAPAQLGRKVAGAVGVTIPDERAGLTNDVVHWMTGPAYGALGAVVAAAAGLPPMVAGVGAGVVAFGVAYSVLPTVGLYDPIWAYDVRTVLDDLTAHLTFGVVTGLVLAGAAAAGHRAAGV